MDLKSFRSLTEERVPIAQTGKNALSVTELNAYIHSLIEHDALLSQVTVCGEISNFVAHRSGHCYFSVKDQDSVIAAVMFRSAVSRLKFTPENGMRVILYGNVAVYEKEGKYQLYVSSMMPDGIGALYVAFEERKRKLAAEGLFDQSRKKRIPKTPSCVGIITSPTGAAVRDMIQVMGRRFPYAKVLLYPALVQGSEAPATLIKGLRYFNETAAVDVIIIGRGGGSMEDLFAFNDESLARAVADSRIPVISAVGHETDFTICDFVADQRAPTPSAAAELAVPETGEMITRFANLNAHMCRLLQAGVQTKRHALTALQDRAVMKNPQLLLQEKQMRVISNTKHLYYTADARIKRAQGEFRELAAKLNALSPLGVLKRGYCVALDEEKKAVSSVDELSVGEPLTMLFADGKATGRVEQITKNKEKQQ